MGAGRAVDPFPNFTQIRDPVPQRGLARRPRSPRCSRRSASARCSSPSRTRAWTCGGSCSCRCCRWSGSSRPGCGATSARSPRPTRSRACSASRAAARPRSGSAPTRRSPASRSSSPPSSRARPSSRTTAAATAALIGGALVAAFAGGFVLKGKSGWCSSLCPMLPVQRMYGQTPFANVPNSHCRPCLGCTKNCFDFNPKVAFLADVHDGDRQWSTTRKLFTAAFPGLVIAFFTEQELAVMALAVGASAGSFLALEALLPATTPKLAAVYGAAAINLFYWWAAPGPDWIAWPLRAAVLALTVVWLRRTFAKERVFLERQGLPTPPRAARLGLGARAALRAAAGDRGHVRGGRAADRRQARHAAARAGGDRRAADRGRLPDGRLRRRPGLRPGRDGEPLPRRRRRAGDARAPRARPRAQPHGLLRPRPRPGDGVDDAAPRLQRGRVDRLPVRPRRRARGGDRQRHRGRHGRRPRPPPPSGLRDRRGRRRAAPALQPHGHLAADLRALGDGRPAPAAGRLVRRQPHHLLAQHARARDRPRRRRGGARHRRAAAVRPAHPRHRLGGVRPGDPRLRRARARSCCAPRRTRSASASTSSRRAPERGGGGRRAARARGRVRAAQARPAHDRARARPRGCCAGSSTSGRGELLRGYLANLGIEVLLEAQAAALEDGSAVLADGRRLRADVLPGGGRHRARPSSSRAAPGSTSRAACSSTTSCARRTARIFAAGDLAEWRGSILGLWPVAVEQAEVAAENAVGGSRAYAGTLPVTMLKVVGVELLSIGAIDGPRELVEADPESLRYRKLVLDDDGRAIGGILLGHPEHVQAVTAAVRESRRDGRLELRMRARSGVRRRARARRRARRGDRRAAERRGASSGRSGT